MECKRCGAPLLQGVILCPECGARQRRRGNTVRCASCHKAVPLELTVCPHCGRNVRPAGPRWGVWLVGLVGLVLVSLWGLGQLPIARVMDEVNKVREQVSGLVQVLGPASSPTPLRPEPAATPTLLALLDETPTPAAPPPTPTAPPEATPTPPGETVETPASEQTEAAPATATATAPETATATPAPTATETPAPTATASPTAAPSATPTARPVAGNTTTYRVQSGDTLSGIAARFGITWEALAAANGLTANSVLRIGQELIVPAAGAPLPPTATATRRPTATPAPPTATPLPQLAAPEPVNPGDKSRFDGANAVVEMTWQPVGGVAPENQYRVVVRWSEQGAPQEHWWLVPATNAPGTQAPAWLQGRADQPAREYTWFVQVVQMTTDGQGNDLIIPLSLPSATRSFSWH